MLFNSFPFLFGFLPIALVLTYWAGARPTPTLAKVTLAALSLAFYAWWRPIYLWLLLFSIAFNYLVGDRIQRAAASDGKRSMQAWLVFGLVVDVGMLGYFKYANFFVDNANALTGANWTLDHIVLPLAISFYTFQKIAYLVEFRPRRGASDDDPRLHAVCRLLSAAHFRPDRPLQGGRAAIAGPAVRPADLEEHSRRTGDHGDRPLQEDRDRRHGERLLGSALFRGRQKRADRFRLGVARGDSLHISALFRFLGLFRHGDRPRPHVRRQAAA